MEDQAEFIGKLTFVCSKHFKPTDFCIKPAGWRGLKTNAVPHLPNKNRLGLSYLVNETAENISKLLRSCMCEICLCQGMKLILISLLNICILIHSHQLILFLKKLNNSMEYVSLFLIENIFY